MAVLSEGKNEAGPFAEVENHEDRIKVRQNRIASRAHGQKPGGDWPSHSQIEERERYMN